MHKNAVLILSMLSANVVASTIFTAALAQNWRTPNPDQPNGYRATEFADKYHGNYHMPAQPQNGYHASEARSHYGGSRFEPSNGWNEQDNDGPGSAFSNAQISSGGPGSAYSNASWHQNGGAQNTLMQRLQRSNRWQAGYHNLAAAGYVPGGGGYGTTNGAAPVPTAGATGFRGRFDSYAPLIERERSARTRAIQGIENGQGGFSRNYAEAPSAEEGQGGFNRIYAGQ